MQDGTFSTPAHLRETGSDRGDAFTTGCPTRQLLDRIADKWSVLVLVTLGDGDMRFNELGRRIDGISQKMLSQTLRSLERDGLVARDVRPTMPVTVTYSIRPLGRGLLTALRAVIDWAETRMIEVAAAQRIYDGQNAR